MIWKNSSDRYGVIAKGFHWLSALIVLGLLPLGFYMVSLDLSPLKLDLYWWHKSFGTLVFFLVWLRLLWRFINPQPGHIPTHQKWERALARLVHVLLYIGMIGMPLSGILMSAAADFPRPFFGLFSLPDVIPGKNKALFDLMRAVHEITAFALFAAVGLHGLGAFKHHFIDKDVTLTRMLPNILPKCGTILVVIVFVAGVGTATFFALIEDDDKVAAQSAVVKQQKNNEAVPVLTAGAPRWEIVTEQSRIGFTAQVQGEEFRGQFTRFDGDIVFDPDNLAQSAAYIRVQVASIQSGSEERDGYIVMKPWLFVESFPESRLMTRRIEKTDENQYVAHADLTMRGVTLPVKVPFSLAFSGQDRAGTATMQARFTVNRLDFEVGTGEWADPEMVENPLVIEVFLAARRVDAAPP